MSGRERSRWGAVLLALAVAGCSEEASPVARDLLAVRPSFRVELPERLVPDLHEGWLGLRPEGWYSRGTQAAGDRIAVHSSRRSASLILSATEPADRVIRFEAWRPGSGAPAPLDLVLNGEPLGRVELTHEPTWFELESPAELWHYGDNRLRFTLDVTVIERAADGSFHGLALSELSYGGPQLVELDEHGARFAAGTALRYCIEDRGDAELHLSGKAEGPGELVVTSRFLSRVNTERAGEQSTAAPRSFRTDGGELELTLPLHFMPRAVLELELRWNSDAGAALRLGTAELLERQPSAPPSIVLISIDTLAARHTSLHGYPRKTTPKLDEFASESTVFDYCLANAPWTLPSYAALMSGYYPSSASTLPFVTETGKTHTVPQGRWVLAETLAAAGYRTGAFIDSPNVSQRLGFAQGFEQFDDSARYLDDEHPASGLRTTMRAALDWLDSLEVDQPYFLFVHANDVHGPYLPKPDFQGRFRFDGLLESDELLPSGSLEGSFGQVSEHMLATDLEGYESEDGQYSPAPFAAAYDEAILSMDAALGEFLEDLRARGAFEEAVILFTADHGEAFNEHELFGHGQLYGEVLQVPLVIWLPPALRSAGSPSRIAEPVQLVDLYPTMIEWAGLRGERPDLHGRSLIPLLEGATPAPATLFAEGGVMRQSSVVFGRWKLIEKWPGENSLPWTMLTNPAVPDEWLEENVPEVGEGAFDESVLLSIAERLGDAKPMVEELKQQLAGPHYELYDLSEDPAEQNDLAEARPEVVERMKVRLERQQTLLRQARAEEGDNELELDPEDLPDLEALGY